MGWEDRDWARKTDRRRVSPVRITVVVAALVLLLLPALERLADEQDASEAAAVETSGGPWPDGVIHYFNAAPEHEWALRQAVAAWNDSGADVRFAPSTRQVAQLVISSEDVEQCGHAHATLGYAPRARAIVFRAGEGRGCDRYSAARVLAHELGHVLGLEHDERGCAAMNEAGNRHGSQRCRPTPPWQWRCRLLEETDVLAAAKLYGGRPRQPRGPANCSLYEPVQSPPAMRFRRDKTTPDHVAFSFVRPANPESPSFLRRFARPAYTFAFVRGRCGERPRSLRYQWSVGPGEEQIALFPVLGKGLHCLRVWSADQHGRLSDTASTSRVRVT